MALASGGKGSEEHKSGPSQPEFGSVSLAALCKTPEWQGTTVVPCHSGSCAATLRPANGRSPPRPNLPRWPRPGTPTWPWRILRQHQAGGTGTTSDSAVPAGAARVSHRCHGAPAAPGDGALGSGRGAGGPPSGLWQILTARPRVQCQRRLGHRRRFAVSSESST